MTTIPTDAAAPPPRWERFAGTLAQNYHRHLVPAIFRPWAQDLLALADPRPGERVLDVACGTGVVARQAARRTPHVTGLDINPGMLEVARSLPPANTIAWLHGDAQQMPFPDGSFDLVLCQQGVQFFPDRPVGLREMRRVLAGGGRMMLAVWGPIERAPGFAALADALARHLGAAAAAAARSPFALSDPAELRELVTTAGLPTVQVHDRERTLRFPSPSTFVHRYVPSSPIAATLDALDNLDAGLLDAVAEDVTAALAPYRTDQGLAFPITNHLVVAAT